MVSQVIKLATRSANSSRQDSARRLLEELTERERAVALAVGQGLTNAQIAKQEYLSVATVKAQITRILGKLGVTNRVQVALIIHDANLGELS